MKNEMKNTVMKHAMMKMARVKDNVIQNTTRETTRMKSAILNNAVMKTAMMKKGVMECVVIKSAVMEKAKKLFCKQRWLGCFSLSLLLLGCASSPDATCPLPQDGICAALHSVDNAWDDKAKKEASSRKKDMPARSPKERLKEDNQDEGIVWFFPTTPQVDVRGQEQHPSWTHTQSPVHIEAETNVNAQTQAHIPNHHPTEVNHAS